MRELLQVEEAAPAGVETTTVRPSVPTVRNLAVDAYRGLVMLLMMGGVLQFSQVSAYHHHSHFWSSASHSPHPVVRLFAARPHPVLLLLPGWRRTPFSIAAGRHGNSVG